MSDPGLGELCDRSPDWSALRADELSRALDRSTHKAVELQRFFAAVEAWWTDSELPDGARAPRIQWLDDVADDFLRRVGDTGIAEIAEELASVDERLVFLTGVASRDMGRHLVRSAVAGAATLLGRQIPRDVPEAAVVEAWTSHTVRLIEIAGISSRAEGLVRVIDALPEWQLWMLLRALGRLQNYDNYFRDLAFAFGLTANPAAAGALAIIGSGSRTSRQNELFSVLGRRTVEDRRWPIPAGALSPGDAQRFLRRVEASAPPEASDQLHAVLDSHRNHDHEIARILSDYMANVPRNHEDVIDFLTRYGTRNRSRALASWGGNQLTISESGSMRSSSIFRQEPADFDAPSPDFDIREVTRRVPVSAAVGLIRAQRNPEFSLTYLNLFCDRPDFEVIAQQIADDPSCTERWEHAHPQYAAVIWSLLERPAYRAPVLDDFRWRIFHTLLPQFEARMLPRAVQRIPDQYRAMIRQSLSDRIAARPSAGELRHLFEVARRLGAEVCAALLGELEVSELTRPPSDPEQRGNWLGALSRLLHDAPEVAAKILAAIDQAAAGELAMDPALSDSTLGTSVASARLALKARLVELWAATDPAACRKELEARAQGDFDFMILAGLDREPLGHVPSEPRRMCPGDEWLDAIAVAAPGLVTSYAVAMLRLGPSPDDQSGAITITTYGYTLVRWLHRRQIEPTDQVWDAASERVRAASAAGDLSTVAAIASLKLPGDAARLRALRELAVRELSYAMVRAGEVRVSGALSQLMAVLRRDAPDLAVALPGLASPG